MQKNKQIKLFGISDAAKEDKNKPKSKKEYNLTNVNVATVFKHSALYRLNIIFLHD